MDCVFVLTPSPVRLVYVTLLLSRPQSALVARPVHARSLRCRVGDFAATELLLWMSISLSFSVEAARLRPRTAGSALFNQSQA